MSMSGDRMLSPRRGIVAAVLVLAAILIGACSSEGDGGSSMDDLAVTDEEGTTAIDQGRLDGQMDSTPPEELGGDDADGLAFMREEEKLAGDVYRALYDMWGLRIFDNIQAAELTHTAAVASLLERYDLADPAVDRPAGDFENETIQKLYDDLVARGSESMTEALTVGALIEELDISDLQARASTNPDIALVYANLERGSRNHLRAFVRQLDRNGMTYTPVHITADAFDDIVSTEAERGRGA
jgi:hypothetical protein